MDLRTLKFNLRKFDLRIFFLRFQFKNFKSEMYFIPLIIILFSNIHAKQSNMHTAPKGCIVSSTPSTSPKPHNIDIRFNCGVLEKSIHLDGDITPNTSSFVAFLHSSRRTRGRDLLISFEQLAIEYQVPYTELWDESILWLFRKGAVFAANIQIRSTVLLTLLEGRLTSYYSNLKYDIVKPDALAQYKQAADHLLNMTMLQFYQEILHEYSDRYDLARKLANTYEAEEKFSSIFRTLHSSAEKV
jgi:hypothetical protein